VAVTPPESPCIPCSTLRSTDVLEEHVAGSKRRSACYLFRAGFLLDLFLNTEDGGNIFLQNAG
jgi:hypothetical protein